MDLGELERQLAQVTLAPYIVRAMRLIDVPRRAGSNMFRHQMNTLAILLDYKTADPVLLKASVIHDLFEAAEGLPGVTREAIECIDADGPAVYALVQEVTVRVVDGVREPKSQYLSRVMEFGSGRARLLKLADRISNMVSLGFVTDRAFVERYVQETRTSILPYAAAINADMHRELSDLVSNREHGLKAWQPEAPPAP
jgi:GTP pyrophosphokinase